MRLLAVVCVASLSLAACSGGAPGEDVGTTGGEALTKVCGASSGGSVQGADVSYYQGNFDWNAAKAGGKAFGYARVSDGTGYIDPQFGNNWTHMKAAGVLRGAYMFFEPGQDATAQANLMVSKVGGMLGGGDLPAMIDVEATGGQSPATIAARIQTWLDIVEKGTGRTPIIYTGAYFWQDNVGSTGFGRYPLWIANYGATCPLVPNGWSGWAMWQYSDGGGSLDHDVFNGSLAQLQALAQPPDVAPRGYLDAADCTQVAGWAQDQDTPDQAIDVHLYFDGPAGSGAHAFAVNAGDNRADLCTAIGSCKHGFSAPPPRSLLDAKKHDVYAYGIDSAVGANNKVLADAPKSFTCAAPPIAKAVRRWVTDPASLAAWKLDAFRDVAPYEDAVLGAVPKGSDLPAAPKLVQSDDGAPAVFVMDGSVKRHVVDPDSFAAWRFDSKAVQKIAAATLAATEQGPDWPRAPLGVKGSGAEVDLLDVAPGTAPGAPPDGSSPGLGGTPPESSPSPTPSAGDSSSAPQGDAGGCNVAAGSSDGGAWALLAIAFALRNRPRRRDGSRSTRAGQ